MSAHTPGPWKHGLASNCILGADGTEVVELPQGADPEAEIWWEHERANARLIAAAPDLLAALVKALEAIERAQHRGPLDGLEMEALRVGRAAIARAEGK